MQEDRIRQEARSLADRLISSDPVEFDSAINQYFEANAAIKTKTLHIQGASQIKKLALLQSLLSSNSKVLQEPVYDDKAKTISFTYSHTYTTPSLPKDIPFAQHFSKKSADLLLGARLHLVADVDREGAGDANGRKLYITKVDVERKQNFPFEGIVPFIILRPLLTLVVLFAANIASFYQQNKEKSPAGMILAALEGIVSTVWNFLLAETGKRQAQAEAWREEKRGQAADFYSRAYDQALATVSSLQTDLESRAKAAGIPVDQYKSQIASTVDDLRAKAAELQSDLEGRAKNAGVSVDEYRQQVEEALAELQKKAQGLGEYFDRKAKEAKEAADKTTNDRNSQDGQSESGDNPPPSFSLEQPVQQRHNEAPIEHKQNQPKQQKQQNQQHDPIESPPTTPLGGHDPTAPNAFSYAQAAAE